MLRMGKVYVIRQNAIRFSCVLVRRSLFSNGDWVQDRPVARGLKGAPPLDNVIEGCL